MPDPITRVRSFEWWMVSNAAAGAAIGSFLTLLVPPFVTEVTGSPIRSGIVFALVSLAAVVGPWFGGRADRSGRHRSYYLVAMLVMSGSFALLSLAAAADRWAPLFAIVIGASYSVQGTIGPAFIVGAGLTHAQVAKQLSAFNLAFPAGQLLGALVITAVQAAGWSAAAVFLTATAVLLVLTAVSWAGMGTPARRLTTAMAVAGPPPGRLDQSPATELSVRRPRSMLWSTFGVFLLVVALSSIDNNGLTSQISNVLPQVYGFTDTTTALLVGVAGLINIPVIIGTGFWMAKTPSMNVYLTGTVIRAGGAVIMALVGLMTTPVLLLAAAAMLITYQGVPMSRVAASDLAVQLAPTGAAQANGYYFAASAVGSVIGCLGAGLAAQLWGYNAVNWFAALFGVVATILVMALARATGNSAAKPHQPPPVGPRMTET